MDTGTEGKIFSREGKENGGSACSYCSTVTYLNNDPSSTIHNNVIK